MSALLPSTPGSCLSPCQAALETSTNLTNWTPLLSIVNHGQPLLWRHTVAHPQRYSRVVPQ
jgi:hypothetical protein